MSYRCLFCQEGMHDQCEATSDKAREFCACNHPAHRRKRK